MAQKINGGTSVVGRSLDESAVENFIARRGQTVCTYVDHGQ
jgi:hypothetical protein